MDGDTQHQHTDAYELDDAVQRINGLGAATEQFFRRILNSLNRRSQLEKSQSAARKLYKQRQELKAVLERREQELERLHGIIATIDEGIIMQDMDGRVILINKAAKDMLGSQKAFRNSELSALFEAYKDITHTDAELTPLGEPTRLEINNTIVGATLAAVADSAGERIGTMIVLRDITQEALGDRLKDQFVTAISHELRTPMNVLKMSSEMLANAPEDAPANRRMVEMIGRNVDVLDRMVVELLDISEMTAGTFEVRQNSVNIEELVWGVIKGMMPEIKTANLDVSVMARDLSHLAVQGDDQRLRWALGHLLQNSIRYTEPSGHIFFMIGLNDNDNLAIQVVDTGVGIAEKDLPHIFERFYRGEPRTSDGRLLDPRGLGQGLFVARTVAEAHQGYLSVQSTVGRGSIFTFVLPLTQEAA
jgi:signal transduction histidine kinase